jgi:hypothetical protein
MNKNIRPYIVYYENEDNGTVRIYDPKLDIFKTVKVLKDDEIYNMNHYNNFHLIKGYEANDEELKRFNIDFISSCQELRTNKILGIEYTKYYNHSSAVEMTFKRFSKQFLDEQEPITQIEHSWFEKCHNGGLTYCDPGLCFSYGYDFSSFYPRTFSGEDFIIPIGVGKEKIIDELPKDLQNIKFGIYHVKINSDKEEFKKIFSTCKTNVYTSTSLQFAMKHKKKYKINIELINDYKPNCLLYDEYTKGHHIFKKWFDSLCSIRKLYPKNILIKHLLSSLWGSLTRANIITKTIEEIEKEKLKVGINSGDYIIKDYICYDERSYYKLLDTKNPYKFNIRLKPFLASQCRNITADVVLTNIDKVIRVQTDNITFSEEQGKLNIEHLKPEEKTTGYIKWHNVNKYEKLC